jgi:hypothetical protein
MCHSSKQVYRLDIPITVQVRYPKGSPSQPSLPHK